MRLNQTFLALAIAGLLATTGCQSFKAPEWTKAWSGDDKPKVVESKYAKPTRLVVIWSPAVLNNVGAKPTRGFGGRIYFYDARNNAVPVEGQLVVYGYDNTKQIGDSKTPDRKYAFTPEQFTQHFSPTELGASYSVWIPWDDVGNDQVEISLVPIFTATSGQLVVGEASKSLLPGPRTESAPLEYNQQTLSVADMVRRPYPGQQGVMQASYLAPPTASNLPPAPASTDLTLKLPNSLIEQLQQAAPAPLPQRMPTAENISAALNARESSAGATGQRPVEVARPLSPSNQPSARFVRPALPAPSSPGSPPVAGRLPWQQFPAGRPSGPASPPAAGQ